MFQAFKFTVKQIGAENDSLAAAEQKLLLFYR